MTDVLILEHDKMVSSINKKCVEKTIDNKSIAVFEKALPVLEFLKNQKTDLLILGGYLPDMSGFDFLSELRTFDTLTDVIMVTSVNDGKHIDKALKLGVFDYIIKPYKENRFCESLERYMLKTKMITSSAIEQKDLDRIISCSSKISLKRKNDLNKGLQEETLAVIIGFMEKNRGDFLTSKQISDEIGLSKVTVRRYMNYLINAKKVKSVIVYTTGGRPGIKYSIV